MGIQPSAYRVVDGRTMSNLEYREYVRKKYKEFDEELDKELGLNRNYKASDNSKEIDRINALARKEGLSYGQYVAKYHLYSDEHIVTAAERERLEKFGNRKRGKTIETY